MAEGLKKTVNGINDGYEDIPEIDLTVSIEPYMYEPLRKTEEYSSEEDSTEDESETDEEELGHGDAWYICGRYVAMISPEECLCCRNLMQVNNKLQDEDALECITQHEGFTVNCLNRYVLETLYYEYVLDNGLPNEPPHELYRYLAYRRFVRWLWDLLQKRHRKILPACVVTSIREAFLSQEFCGFKYPDGQ